MKKYIYLTVIILVLTGIFAYIYYKYEKPSQELGELSNISISAQLDGKKIKTGFIIETQNSIYEGNTSNYYELVQIPKNQVIKIYNKNIENQTYYADLKEFNVSSDFHRIDLNLIKPSKINVEVINKKPLLINLTSTNVKDIDFCIDYSFAYIFIKATNYTEIKKEGYNYKCYQGFDLDSSKEIEITYSEFKEPNSDDYINLIIIQNQFKGVLDQKIKIL